MLVKSIGVCLIFSNKSDITGARCLFVSNESVATSKAAATFAAQKGPFASVKHQVSLEIVDSTKL